jgi:hypothetical protein
MFGGGCDRAKDTTSLVPCSAMGDPELTAVRRPFEAAFLRMCQAGDLDLLRDELSNMLHHMYRLSELCCRRWQVNPSGFNAKLTGRVDRGQRVGESSWTGFAGDQAVGREL